MYVRRPSVPVDPPSINARATHKSKTTPLQAVYEPVEDTEDGGRVSYIKMHNVGQKMATRYCNGYLPSEVSLSDFWGGCCRGVGGSGVIGWWCLESRALTRPNPQNPTPHNDDDHRQMCLFLRNIHIFPRKIWLTRHAESVDQVWYCRLRGCVDLYVVCLLAAVWPSLSFFFYLLFFYLFK